MLGVGAKKVGGLQTSIKTLTSISGIRDGRRRHREIFGALNFVAFVI